MIFTVLTVVLILLGTVMLFSAGSSYAKLVYGDSFYYLKTHLKHLALGLAIALVFIIGITPTNGRWLAVGMYGASLLLLAAVLVVGTRVAGARRWLNLGFINFQPSELAKTAMIMLIALYMSVYEKKISGAKPWKNLVYGFIIPICLIVLPVSVLVVLERHWSGALIVFVIGACTVFFGGAYLHWYLIAVPAILAPAGVIAYSIPYVRSRIEGWTNRGADALGIDWQTTQGLYAIGTGGLFGLGLGQSRLKYGYVSQPQNDFVFTVVCEELGFFGAAAIMVLFLALTSRGLMLAVRSEDRFSGIVIAGISFKIILHVLLNIAVVTGVGPNTGISMPFFSSGGTATLIQLMDAGILLGLSRFCKGESFE
jgi:cell division protein FtsW